MMFRPPLVLSAVALMSILIPVDSREAGLLGDTVTLRIWTNAGDILPSTEYVVSSGAEYYSYSPGSVFEVERLVDIGDNTIHAHHQIEYQWYGGGCIYDIHVGIYGLDWSGGCTIGDIQIIHQNDTSSIIDFGPNHVELGLGGACSYGYAGPYDHSITVELLPSGASAVDATTWSGVKSMYR